MFYQNEHIMVGHIASDGAEVRTLDGGKKVANLRIAINESFKQGDEWKERTEFLPVTIWNPKLIERVEKRLAKGDYVRIQAKLSHSSVEKGGETQYRTDIIGLKLNHLAPKGRDDDHGDD